MSQTLSELEQLETYYAPCITKAQSQKRCLALQAKKTSLLEFIDIAAKLDPAMRIALLNYLETPSSSNTYNNDNYIANNAEYTSLTQEQTDEQTEDRTEQTNTLSHKKSQSKKRTKNKKPKRIIS